MPPTFCRDLGEYQLEEADIIVCGGGGAGCPISARLAENFPDLKVLLIERGPDNRQLRRLDKPLDSLLWLFDQNPYLHWVESLPQPQLNGRTSTIPVGNILGGGTTINTMMYNTAAASDYDDWKQPGWSFADLEPLIQKVATISYTAIQPEEQRKADKKLIFEISKGGHQIGWNATIHAAFQCIKDIPYVDFLTDYKTAHAVGRWPKMIDANGLRTTTANSYTHRTKSSNLSVLTNTTIARVLIEDGRAVGVEVCATQSHGARDFGKLRTIKARYQTILCCGTIATPGVLERSGVGDPAVLKRAGVAVQVDLPGVGAELDDHQLTVNCYHVKDNFEEEFDGYARGLSIVKYPADKLWEETGTGLAATNGFDCGFKISPDETDLREMGQEAAKYWHKISAGKPDKAIYNGTFLPFFYAKGPRPTEGKFISFGGFNMYPASRGNVHISSSDPFAPPRINVGLLTDPVDMPVHVWMYKLQREVFRRLPWFVAEHAGSHPAFPTGSKAALRTVSDSPMPPVNKIVNLRYTKDDDRAIEKYITETIATAYHTVSTCPMKDKGQGGVVNPDLEVYGVRDLKVADLSVVPQNVGTNTTSVVLLIAEKAVEIVTKELRRRGVGSSDERVQPQRAKL